MEPPLATLEGVDHRDLTVAGVRLRVAEIGSGPPLVLQHGWPQYSWAWRKLIPQLAARHRVICPDLRGFGGSAAPADGNMLKERLAADLIGVLDALELERVRLVGHDWGGFAGFLACLQAPERFSGFLALAIIHPWPPASRPTPKRLASVSYQFVIAAPLLGGALLRRRAMAERFLARAGGGVWDAAERSAYAAALSRPESVAATVGLYRQFLTKELKPLTAGRYASQRLSVPTRLLIGDRDPVITPDGVAGFEDHTDAMTLEWVPGAGHWLPEEHPELVIERIEALPAP